MGCACLGCAAGGRLTASPMPCWIATRTPVACRWLTNRPRPTQPVLPQAGCARYHAAINQPSLAWKSVASQSVKPAPASSLPQQAGRQDGAVPGGHQAGRPAAEPRAEAEQGGGHRVGSVAHSLGLAGACQPAILSISRSGAVSQAGRHTDAPGADPAIRSLPLAPHSAPLYFVNCNITPDVRQCQPSMPALLGSMKACHWAECRGACVLYVHGFVLS